jgi:hypothetical protein
MDIFRKWIGYDATHFSVRFTGEELRSLDRAVLPKLQEASTLSARTCQVLVSHVYNIWDTDSGDHLAMRRAGLQAYLRYASCQRCYENKRWVHLLGAAAMLIGLKRRWPANVLVGIACTWLLHGAPRTTIPTLQRIKGVQPVRAEPENPTPEAGTEGTDDGSDNGRTGGVAEGAGDDVQGAPGSNLDTILPGRDQTRDPNQELGLHRGEPTDRQLAGESGNSRVWLNNGVIGIRGQSFTREGDTFTQCPTDQINGLVVGPLAVEPNVFSMTKECVDHAYQERVEKKQRIPGQDGVPDVRADIKASIGAIVRTAMSDSKHHKQWAVFSTEKIRNWIASNQWYTDVKSKKWSEARMVNALNKLYAEADPEVRFKGAIKFEQMPEGKAPRILVADGDEGQVMALLTIKCFEDLLFEHMEARSTKHCTRDGARDRACKMHRRDDKLLSVIEGDGSAWDFTNTHPMRKMVENPILKKITAELIDAGLCPASWHEEYIKITEKKKIKIFIDLKCEDKMYVKMIEACRRSGERGTSCLNWWMNFVVWTAVIFPASNSYKFLNVEQRWAVDRHGVHRYYCITCEGDDSLMSTSPQVDAQSAFGVDAEAAWANCGFNMKIIYATTRATFTGSWFLVDKHGLSGESIAELPRMLKNWPICTSAEGKETARKGDIGAANRLTKAACLSRADELASRLPSIAQKFLDFMPESDVGYDHELSMRSQGEEGHSASEIEHLIQLKLAEKHQDEISLLNRFGLTTNQAEWKGFLEEPWQHDPAYFLGHIGGYRKSIPTSWR